MGMSILRIFLLNGVEEHKKKGDSIYKSAFIFIHICMLKLPAQIFCRAPHELDIATEACPNLISITKKRNIFLDGF